MEPLVSLSIKYLSFIGVFIYNQDELQIFNHTTFSTEITQFSQIELTVVVIKFMYKPCDNKIFFYLCTT